MNLQEILDHINSRTNKDQSGNTYRIDRYNTDLRGASDEMFSWLYGLPQQYRPGMPLPMVGYEITQLITDNLRGLKVNMGGPEINDPGPLLVNSDGVAVIPSDYVHHGSMNYGRALACGNVTYPPIEVLADDEWSAVINSPLRMNRLDKYPICNFQNGYMRFLPKGIGFVNFVYLRSPKTPFFDYYIDVTNAVIYMPPGTSHTLQPGEMGSQGQTSGTLVSQTVELEWPENTHMDFANIILSYVSDNLRDAFIKQSAERRKEKGI